jgi:predicted NUDIX family NTP pyrophosphohydrolase
VAKRSAGILVYRERDVFEFLVVHPGGPFWAKRDAASWSITKGEIDDGEDPLAAARRELAEELGAALELTGLVDLGEVRQKAGKIVHAWGARGDFDPETLASNTFEMEWPPRSGQKKQFPEIDRIGWFGLPAAMKKIIAYQRPFLIELQEKLS